MRIDGQWLINDDDIVRPAFRGDILSGANTWITTWFLLDTGADCTVFCPTDLQRLGFPTREVSTRLGGVGGVTNSVSVTTQIRFTRDDGGFATFRGDYDAFTNPDSLDMSVLGRDITDIFTVIVDRPADVVSMIRGRHRYRIETT